MSKMVFWLLIALPLCGLTFCLGFLLSPSALKPNAQPDEGNQWQAHEIPEMDRKDHPAVFSGHLDRNGKPITIACETCHATREPNVNNSRGDGLDLFHTGLVVKHGEISCLSCHNRHNYDTLALSDGREVPFSESIRLCAQCHGPQYRDYNNGSHGGMTGYWDTTRGPRERKICTDCHDPHAPQFPRLMPAPAPKDRHLKDQSHRDDH